MSEKFRSFADATLIVVRGTPVSAIILICSLLLIVSGAGNLREDIWSTVSGIQDMESILGIVAATWGATYWLVALGIQALGTITITAWVVKRQTHWISGVIGIACQIVDSLFDLYYRGAGNPFVDATGVFSWNKLIASSAFTFLYTFVFSEIALTIGLLFFAVFARDGSEQVARIVARVVEMVIYLITELIRQLMKVGKEVKRILRSIFSGTALEKELAPKSSGYTKDTSIYNREEVPITSTIDDILASDEPVHQKYRPLARPSIGASRIPYKKK